MLHAALQVPAPSEAERAQVLEWRHLKDSYEFAVENEIVTTDEYWSRYMYSEVFKRFQSRDRDAAGQQFEHGNSYGGAAVSLVRGRRGPAGYLYGPAHFSGLSPLPPRL